MVDASANRYSQWFSFTWQGYATLVKLELLICGEPSSYQGFKQPVVRSIPFLRTYTNIKGSGLPLRLLLFSHLALTSAQNLASNPLPRTISLQKISVQRIKMPKSSNSGSSNSYTPYTINNSGTNSSVSFHIDSDPTSSDRHLGQQLR